MTTHSLKVWPEFYSAIEDGSKLFELRRDDRDFKVGDWLALREWKPADLATATAANYTGRRAMRRISYVLRPNDVAEFGSLSGGFVILGLSPPIGELGCEILGRKVYLGSTDMKELAEASKYMMDLHTLVEMWREQESSQKKGGKGGMERGS